MSHVAVEDDVFAIATNGGMRLGSEVLHGASTGMSQTIDFRAAVVGIDARQNELVLVWRPVAGRRRLVIAVVGEKFRSRGVDLVERDTRHGLRSTAQITV